MTGLSAQVPPSWRALLVKCSGCGVAPLVECRRPWWFLLLFGDRPHRVRVVDAVVSDGGVAGAELWC